MSDLMSTGRIRDCERQRGSNATFIALWFLLGLHYAADAVGGRASWWWVALSVAFCVFSAVAWWYYRGLLKRHDAACERIALEVWR